MLVFTMAIERCQSRLSSSAQDSAKAKWTSSGVGGLRFRALGVA
jgi:hypothetical protein